MTKTVAILAWLAISCGLQAVAPTPVSQTATEEATLEVPISTTTTKSEPGTADLKEQLESDLRARRPEEFAFIARVIYLLDEGQLSRELVEGTYLWARTHQPRPFQYFERAMRIRAAAAGVTI